MEIHMQKLGIIYRHHVEFAWSSGLHQWRHVIQVNGNYAPNLIPVFQNMVFLGE